MNYTGVIIGPELDYDFITKKLVVYKDLYKDKNGKNSIKDDEILLDYIINIYKTIFLRGIEGTYVYVCNPNLRKYLSQYIPLFEADERKSTLEFLNSQGVNTIPYYDISVAAGSFSDMQAAEEVKYINMPELSNPDDYFACKVVGDSMNKVIPNGSICLFRKYFGGSRNGLITLVEGREIWDSEMGSNYTIKEYTSKKTTDEDGWKHEEIILKPLSTFDYDSIVLRDELVMNFRVLGIFEKVL
ncbi:S24 family peptidase [Sphingobacterium rhinopitheci]|uniref:S24 family peptidase n=1 Tax=Sphingobacterium rhinopitheci TaxID=2781960 RepID=UPI001F519CB9|nr:DNA/RNA helicase domain-containing protein [Sphingobacterium rhinopitheci]